MTPLRRHQSGQALTEFLVISLVLLPLFLLFPMVARYQDIARATQQASRYAAFESMNYPSDSDPSSWKSANVLSAEVQQRFFSDPSTAVRTPAAGQTPAAHPFWGMPNGNPLISNLEQDVRVRFGANASSTDQAGAFSASSSALLFSTIDSQLKLPDRGIYTANVTVALANLPAGLKFYQPFDTLNLSMQRSTSLLIDGWSAPSAAAIENRLANAPGIFPLGQLSSVNASVGGVVSVIETGQVSPPKLGQLEIWRDVVPKDRLK